MKPQELCRLIGQNVRRRRTELQLTQQALADSLGIAQTYLSDIETGKRNPSAAMIANFAEALGMVPADLLKGAPATLPPIKLRGPHVAPAEHATQ